MTIRCLFLAEGSSDAGLAMHIRRIAAEQDVAVSVTSPDLARLPEAPGHSVEAKLRAVASLGGSNYAFVAIHRDANGAGAEARRLEIERPVGTCMPGVRYVAIVPVRMTETWLLLEEQLIRIVAGNPNGRVPLRIPSPRHVEQVADPKALLRETLVAASETSGRRLKTFRQRFTQQRQQLLERVDPSGPVSDVPSWRRFVDDVAAVVTDVGASVENRRM